MEYTRLSDIDFKANIKNRVFAQFLVSDKSVRLQKDKVTKFISFNMTDKGVVIEAKKFGATDAEIDMIQEGKAYNAAIDVQPYAKAPAGFSCIIYNIDMSGTPPEAFADWSEDLQGSQKIIENALGEIINTPYGQIAYPIVIKYWSKFAVWTAAKGQHHTQLGGLLTHTAEVVKLVDDISDFFCLKYGEDFINKPLLLASAILHDLGKVKELAVDSMSGHTEYSVDASLATHIMDILSEVDIQAYKLSLGIQEFEVNEINEEEATKTDEQLKEELEVVALLKHCLAAHHGKLEWGSPITPSIPEAYLLHKMDEIDAEMFRFNRSFKDMEPGKSNSVWGGDGMKSTYKESTK